MKKMLIVTVVILCFLASSFIVSAEEPTYDITISPSSPAPKSTIKFTADISGGTISEVYLNVKECKITAGDLFCFADDFNESMSKNSSSGEYEGEITLKHSDATIIEYYLVINSDGTFYDFQEDYDEKDLKTSSSNGGNGSSDKTPGFELIVFIISVAVLLFIIRQKRVE